MGDWKLISAGTTINARHGCYLLDVESFDAAHFRLSKSEATLLDPQARMLLEECQVRLCSGPLLCAGWLWQEAAVGAVFPDDASL